MLRGWALHLDGEPLYQVRPADHDLAARQALVQSARPDDAQLDGDPLALVSLSSPLGLEDLPVDVATELLNSWHRGAADLPSGFAAWAAVTRQEPDLGTLARRLGNGFVGLQIPATWLATPDALENLVAVLAVCEQADRPVLVHPGPVADRDPSATELPGWWPAVVDYPSQLQAAWWSWHECGRASLPRLRIGFVAGAGLAPLQHERLQARGGQLGPIDPGVFVETSSYGPQAVDALIRRLGIDAIVRGSDRPYAEPVAFDLGAAVDHAIDVCNPRRFLFGETS